MSLDTEKVVKASRLLDEQEGISPASEGLSLESLGGWIAELSEEVSFGAITLAAELIAAAQELGAPVAWISARSSLFFPPDLAENGIEVGAIAVVSVADEREAVWAADLLARSAAFGLVILDIGKGTRVGDGELARLLHLARRNRTAILFLTIKGKGSPSLSSLVALHGVVRSSARTGDGEVPAVRVEARIVKDKRGVPRRTIRREYEAPPGVR